MDLVKVGNDYYLIDTEQFRRKMFEPMPMVTPPPTDFTFRNYLDYAPKVMDNRCVLLTYDDVPQWDFVFLFPMGLCVSVPVGQTWVSKEGRVMYRRLECPECGFDAWTVRTGTLFCGNCAGDCGRDVSMETKETRQERPSEEELAKVDVNDSWKQHE